MHNLQRLADWMDTAFEIPGTGIRFGLDALIGLVPGMGDTVTSLIALYIVGAASRMGVPRVTLIRMITNVGIDWLVGIVPFLGDVFDVYWKANQRNMAILRGHLGNSARERQRRQESRLGGSARTRTLAHARDCRRHHVHSPRRQGRWDALRRLRAGTEARLAKIDRLERIRAVPAAIEPFRRPNKPEKA